MKLKYLFERGAWKKLEKSSNIPINGLVYGKQNMQTINKDDEDSAHQWWKEILTLFQKKFQEKK